MQGKWKYALTLFILALAAVSMPGLCASRERSDTVAPATHHRRPVMSAGFNVAPLTVLNLSANLELHVNPRLSLHLPVTAGWLDFFSRRTKFQQFTLQPGMRAYLTRNDLNSLLAGAHFGLSWYSFAFGGDSGYIDHKNNHPAWGFGLSIGWRHRFKRDPRWFVEAEVGAGWYHVNYDVYDNMTGGKLRYTRRHGWWGLDRLSLTIGYTFHL